MIACLGLKLKREAADLEICERIIKELEIHGSFNKLESIFDTSANTLHRFIRTRIEIIKKCRPDLYKKYRLAKKKCKTGVKSNGRV